MQCPFVWGREPRFLGAFLFGQRLLPDCPVFSVGGGEGTGRDIGRWAVHLTKILGQPYSISPLPFLLPVNGSC